MSIEITDRDGKTHSVASAGVGAGGLTTGIIGTSLGALALLRDGDGLLGGLLGGHRGRRGCEREGAEGFGIAIHDTRILAEKDATIAALISEKYTDNKFAHLERELCELRCREAVLCEKVKDLHEDLREGDERVMAYGDCHFARVKKAIPAEEVVQFHKPEVVKIIEKVVFRDRDEDCDEDEKKRRGKKHGE